MGSVVKCLSSYLSIYPNVSVFCGANFHCTEPGAAARCGAQKLTYPGTKVALSTTKTQEKADLGKELWGNEEPKSRKLGEKMLAPGGLRKQSCRA